MHENPGSSGMPLALVCSPAPNDWNVVISSDGPRHFLSFCMGFRAAEPERRPRFRCYRDQRFCGSVLRNNFLRGRHPPPATGSSVVPPGDRSVARELGLLGFTTLSSRGSLEAPGGNAEGPSSPLTTCNGLCCSALLLLSFGQSPVGGVRLSIPKLGSKIGGLSSCQNVMLLVGACGWL